MRWRIECQDVRAWADAYDGPPFHALLTDPPYELDFLRKAWDRSGIAFESKTWEQFGRHLLPGALGMAFASARGWHRLACAIEDAGFVLHPTIFGWLKAHGFPKAVRVPDPRFREHRYGRQALKPALEPIIVFQKPCAGAPSETIRTHGTGTFHIEAARIGREAIRTRGQKHGTSPTYGHFQENYPGDVHLGRWPANFVLGHSPQCRRADGKTWTCAADCPVRDLDSQSGSRPTRPFRKRGGSGHVYERWAKQAQEQGYHDAGTVSRFFFQADWCKEVAARLEEAAPVIYMPKAARSERDAGITNAEQPLMDEWSPSTPLADRMHGKTRYRNYHPTVKPIKLARWLAALLLPPADYAPRRILVPFAGVMSEVIGAGMAGWDEALAVERHEDYVRLGEARLRHWIEPSLFAAGTP